MAVKLTAVYLVSPDMAVNALMTDTDMVVTGQIARDLRMAKIQCDQQLNVTNEIGLHLDLFGGHPPSYKRLAMNLSGVVARLSVLRLSSR